MECHDREPLSLLFSRLKRLDFFSRSSQNRFSILLIISWPFFGPSLFCSCLFLNCGDQNRAQYSARGPTSTVWSGMITPLYMLTLPLQMQSRIWFAFTVAAAHCCLMFILMSLGLLQQGCSYDPRLYWALSLHCPKCRNLHYNKLHTFLACPIFF